VDRRLRMKQKDWREIHAFNEYNPPKVQVRQAT
jgi:hypothetical protein